MKTIYLVRHGKAVSRYENVKDFDRDLVGRGRNDALIVAGHMAENGAVPSIIVSSPARRTLETARQFARRFGYPTKKIRTRKAIYDQNAGAFMEIIKGLDDSHGSAMLVGHNPVIENIAFTLSPSCTEVMSTGSVYGIALEVNSWCDIKPGAGDLTMFLSPKALKAQHKTPYKKVEVKNKLIEGIELILSGMDENTTKRMTKPIRKTSAALADTFIRILKK